MAKRKAKKVDAAKADACIAELERWRSSIRKGYAGAREQQTGEQDARPRGRPINQLKQRVYRQVLEVRAAKLGATVTQMVEARDGARWKGHAAGQAMWILRLLEGGKRDLLANPARSRMAAELELALLNRIAPDYLLAFLYEVGAIERVKRDLDEKTVFTWAERYRAGAASAATADGC